MRFTILKKPMFISYLWKTGLGQVPVLVSYWGLEEAGVGAPDPAFHKNLSSCTNFFSSLSQIPFFRFQLKIRKLKKDFMLQKLINVRFRLALSILLPKGSSFSYLAKTKPTKRRGEEEDVSKQWGLISVRSSVEYLTVEIIFFDRRHCTLTRLFLISR